MKRLILKITILLCSVLALVYLISRFDNRKEINDSNAIKLKVAADKYKQLDYLFVGSSYVYCAIKPSYFDSLGLKTYNMGIATAGPYFYELVIDDYIKKTSIPPQNIILNIALTTFSDIASDGWTGYPIHRYLNYPKSNEYIFYHYTDATTYLKMIRKSFKKAITNFFSEEPQTSKIYKTLEINKGFTGGDELFTDSIYNINKPSYTPYLKSVLSAKKLSHFIKILEKYRNMGITIHLIEIPTFRLGEFFNANYKLEYSKVFNKFKNTPILKYNESLSDSCFGNIDHMNNKGADIYTRYLIKNLNIK